MERINHRWQCYLECNHKVALDFVALSTSSTLLVGDEAKQKIFKYLPAVMGSIFMHFISWLSQHFTLVSTTSKLSRLLGFSIINLLWERVWNKGFKKHSMFLALSALLAKVGQSRAIRVWKTRCLTVCSFMDNDQTWELNFTNCRYLLDEPHRSSRPTSGRCLQLRGHDIGSYSGYIFNLLLVVGLIFVGSTEKEAGLGFEGRYRSPILVITILRVVRQA